MKTKLLAIFLFLSLSVNAFAGQFPFSFWKTSGPACTDDIFTVQSGTLTGSVVRHGMACSPNGTYCFGVVLEQQFGSNGTYHFYTSADSALTWTKAAYTQAVTSGIADDALFGYLPSPRVLVANNGKAFASFGIFFGSNSYDYNGVYTDVSAGTPVVSQSAATGADGYNNIGTAGFLCATANNDTGYIDGDLTDLSFVAVICQRQSNNLVFRFFTNGGATYQNSDLTGNGNQYGSRVGVVVTGSGSSHRVFFLRPDTTASELQYTYYDQPSNTAVGTGQVTTDDPRILDCDGNSTRAYCLMKRVSDGSPVYFSWNTTGSPTFTSTRALSTQIDASDLWGLQGYENTSGDPYNPGKSNGAHVLINPSDSNNVFFAFDAVHPDGVQRPMLYEVRNDSSFGGEIISQTSSTGFTATGLNSGNAYDGQVITFSSQAPRTVAFLVRQSGTIPSGSVSCEIKATSGSAPTQVPTGSALYTSTNTYVAKNITRDSNAQWLFCNFTGVPALTGAYAVSYRLTHPLSGSNYTQKSLSTSNPYGSGNYYTCDNTNACTGNSASDAVFLVFSEWPIDMGVVADARSEKSGTTFWGTDTSVDLKSSGTLRFMTKASPTGISATYRRQAGHVYTGSVTIGSGATASAVGALSVAGYDPAKFDENLVFNTQCGTSGSARKDAITGVLATNERCEDRSGINHANDLTGYGTPSSVADAAFDSGFANVFNGSSSNVTYAITTPTRLQGTNVVFGIELEFKPATIGNQALAAFYSSTSVSGGWAIVMTPSGNIFFATAGGFQTQTSSTLTAGVKTKIKVTGDGSAIHIYFDGVEQPYSAQTTGGYTINAPNTGNTSFTLGAYNDNTVNANGRIGIFRITRGSDTFASADYFSQPEQLHPINTGKIGAMLQGIGTGSATINTGFNQWGTLVPNSCFP